MVKVIELKGNKKYAEWMAENGEKVNVINVAATNQRWNVWTGAIGSAVKGEKNFTVTYEEKN